MERLADIIPEHLSPRNLVDTDKPSIGTPTVDAVVPFTTDEVDSLKAIRDAEYDPHQKERRLMGAIELAAIIAQPVRELYKLATRPILGSGNRFLNYFAGTKYLPYTRTVRINGGAMANSSQEAAEIAKLAKGKTGEEIIGVRPATTKVMKPRHYLREYRTPITTSEGKGVLREVRPTDEYWKFPDDAYNVKFDTGIDRVRPDFSVMPKRGGRVSGSVNTEIIIPQIDSIE